MKLKKIKILKKKGKKKFEKATNKLMHQEDKRKMPDRKMTDETNLCISVAISSGGTKFKCRWVIAPSQL